METIDRRPNHLSSCIVEGDPQLVGEGCLPRRVWPVDRHTSRMSEINRVDQSDEAANQLGTIQRFGGRHHNHESTSSPVPPATRSSPAPDASMFSMGGVRRNPCWRSGARDGIRLACADYGGEGSPVVLLHGLAGNACEWGETASWLTGSHRVFALDARGHGQSERRPADVSRAAHVGDVAFWLRELDLEPVHLVGQSLGGHTAFLVAAGHPDLLRSLVVAEATPATGPHFPQAVRAWLESWPVPFPSHEAATAFFGGDSLWAQGWTSGLEPSTDGLRPPFDVDVMVASLDEIATTSYWEEWTRVRTPALIVRAENGVPRADVLRMTETHPHAQLVEIPQAEHDVHLEKPIEWRQALETFLRAREPNS